MFLIEPSELARRRDWFELDTDLGVDSDGHDHRDTWSSQPAVRFGTRSSAGHRAKTQCKWVPGLNWQESRFCFGREQRLATVTSLGKDGLLGPNLEFVEYVPTY